MVSQEWSPDRGRSVRSGEKLRSATKNHMGIEKLGRDRDFGESVFWNFEIPFGGGLVFLVLSRWKKGFVMGDILRFIRALKHRYMCLLVYVCSMDLSRKPLAERIHGIHQTRACSFAFSSLNRRYPLTPVKNHSTRSAERNTRTWGDMYMSITSVLRRRKHFVLEMQWRASYLDR